MPGEFKEIYEKSPDKMTQVEFKIATVGLLNSISQRLDLINGTVQSVNKHTVYFKLIGGFTGGIIIPILVWLIIKSFN